VGGGQVKAGNRETAANTPSANDDLVSLKPQPAFSLDSMRIDEAGGTRPFMNGHAGSIELLAKSRMFANVAHDLVDTFEQARILKSRLAHSNAVLPELSSLSDQSRGMG
jgi:hypothetical protein